MQLVEIEGTEVDDALEQVMSEWFEYIMIRVCLYWAYFYAAEELVEKADFQEYAIYGDDS